MKTEVEILREALTKAMEALRSAGCPMAYFELMLVKADRAAVA
jgi:hypothetical protein